MSIEKVRDKEEKLRGEDLRWRDFRVALPLGLVAAVTLIVLGWQGPSGFASIGAFLAFACVPFSLSVCRDDRPPRPERVHIPGYYPDQRIRSLAAGPLFLAYGTFYIVAREHGSETLSDLAANVGYVVLIFGFLFTQLGFPEALTPRSSRKPTQ